MKIPYRGVGGADGSFVGVAAHGADYRFVMRTNDGQLYTQELKAYMLPVFIDQLHLAIEDHEKGQANLLAHLLETQAAEPPTIQLPQPRRDIEPGEYAAMVDEIAVELLRCDFF